MTVQEVRDKFGIKCEMSVDDGWAQLLNECLEAIKSTCRYECLTFYAMQIKEKFGGLRFYYQVEVDPERCEIPEDPDKPIMKLYNGDVKLDKPFILDKGRAYGTINGIIRMAEHMSYYICEVCGERGEYRSALAWKKTLCDKHYAETVAELKQRDAEMAKLDREDEEQDHGQNQND